MSAALRPLAFSEASNVNSDFEQRNMVQMRRVYRAVRACVSAVQAVGQALQAVACAAWDLLRRVFSATGNFQQDHAGHRACPNCYTPGPTETTPSTLEACISEDCEGAVPVAVAICTPDEADMFSSSTSCDLQKPAALISSLLVIHCVCDSGKAGHAVYSFDLPPYPYIFLRDMSVSQWHEIGWNPILLEARAITLALASWLSDSHMC